MKLPEKGLIKTVFLIFTSVCTILSFFGLILPDKVSTDFVVYFFEVSIVIFLLVAVGLMVLFIHRLQPDRLDGRSFLIVLSIVLSVASAFLYFKDQGADNRWGISFILGAFLASLLVIILLLYSILKRSISENNPSEYSINSVSTKLVSKGNNEYEYEIIKNIQSKTDILSFLPMNFKWTGDKVTKRSIKPYSSLQKVLDLSINKNTYDNVLLGFSRALRFNQSIPVHLKISGLTDRLTPMKPFLSFAIKKDQSVPIVRFQVVLRDCPDDFNKEAVFERKPLDAPPAVEYEENCKIVFDHTTKSYTFDLPNPESGYDYRVSWIKY